jgi:hypothetical protein
MATDIAAIGNTMTFVIGDRKDEYGKLTAGTVRIIVTELASGALQFDVWHSLKDANSMAVNGLYIDALESSNESFLKGLVVQPLSKIITTSLVGNDTVTSTDKTNAMTEFTSDGAGNIDAKGYDIGLGIAMTPDLLKLGEQSFSFILLNKEMPLTIEQFMANAGFGVNMQSLTDSKLSTEMYDVVTAYQANDDNIAVSDSRLIAAGDLFKNDIVASRAATESLTRATLLGEKIEDVSLGKEFKVQLLNAEGKVLDGVSALVTINADGSYRVNAAATEALAQGETGYIKLAIQVTSLDTVDFQRSTASSIMTIKIEGANNGPEAMASAVTADENTTTTGMLSATDVDHGAVLHLVSISTCPCGEDEGTSGGGQNNGFGNGDQTAPGNSLMHNNAENAGGVSATNYPGNSAHTGSSTSSTSGGGTSGGTSGGGTSGGSGGDGDNDSGGCDIAWTAGQAIAIENAAGQTVAYITFNNDLTYVLDTTPGTDIMYDGDVVTKDFTFTVADKAGETSCSTITITVNGAGTKNTAPTISSADASLTGYGELKTAIVIADIDKGDFGSLLGATATIIDLAGNPIDFILALDGTESEIQPGVFFSVSVTGDSYTIRTDKTAAYMSATDKLDVKLDLTATDTFGVHATTTVNATVFGIDDAPTISSTDASLTMSASPFAPNSTLTTEIKIADIDNGDHATLTAATATLADGTMFHLALDGTETQIKQGVFLSLSGTGDSYTIRTDNKTAAYMAAGEKLDVTLDLTATDTYGDHATTTVNATVIGVNNRPQFVSSGPILTPWQGSLDEDSRAVFDLSKTFTDPDNGDQLTFSLTPALNFPGLIFLQSLKDSAGVEHITELSPSERSGIASQFSLSPSGELIVDTSNGGFNFLAEGMVASVKVSYKATDLSGAFASTTGIVTITGTNDAPIIDQAQDIVATGITGGSGQVLWHDPDIGDIDTLAVSMINNGPKAFIHTNTGGQFEVFKNMDAPSQVYVNSEGEEFRLDLTGGKNGFPTLKITNMGADDIFFSGLSTHPTLSPGQSTSFSLGFREGFHLSEDGSIKELGWEVAGGEGATGFIDLSAYYIAVFPGQTKTIYLPNDDTSVRWLNESSSARTAILPASEPIAFEFGVPFELAQGVIFTAFADGSYTLDTSGAAYLGAGEELKWPVTFTVTDNHGAHTTTIVNLTATGVNEAPTAAEINVTAADGYATGNIYTDILALGTDPDNNHVLDFVSIAGYQVNGSILKALQDGGTTDVLKFGSILASAIPEAERILKMLDDYWVAATGHTSPDRQGFIDAYLQPLYSAKTDLGDLSSKNMTDQNALIMAYLHSHGSMTYDDNIWSGMETLVNRAANLAAPLGPFPEDDIHSQGGVWSFHDAAGHTETVVVPPGSLNLDIAGGSLQIWENGDYVLTIAANADGVVPHDLAIGYKISDEWGATSDATVNWRNNNVPVATSIAITVTEGTALSVNLNDHATDLNGDSLTFGLAGGSAHVQNADGSITQIDTAGLLSIDALTGIVTVNADSQALDFLDNGQTAILAGNWTATDAAGAVSQAASYAFNIAGVTDAPTAATIDAVVFDKAEGNIYTNWLTQSADSNNGAVLDFVSIGGLPVDRGILAGIQDAVIQTSIPPQEDVLHQLEDLVNSLYSEIAQSGLFRSVTSSQARVIAYIESAVQEYGSSFTTLSGQEQLDLINQTTLPGIVDPYQSDYIRSELFSAARSYNFNPFGPESDENEAAALELQSSVLNSWDNPTLDLGHTEQTTVPGSMTVDIAGGSLQIWGNGDYALTWAAGVHDLSINYIIQDEHGAQSAPDEGVVHWMTDYVPVAMDIAADAGEFGREGHIFINGALLNYYVTDADNLPGIPDGQLTFSAADGAMTAMTREGGTITISTDGFMTAANDPLLVPNLLAQIGHLYDDGHGGYDLNAYNQDHTWNGTYGSDSLGFNMLRHALDAEVGSAGYSMSYAWPNALGDGGPIARINDAATYEVRDGHGGMDIGQLDLSINLNPDIAMVQLETAVYQKIAEIDNYIAGLS